MIARPGRQNPQLAPDATRTWARWVFACWIWNGSFTEKKLNFLTFAAAMSIALYIITDIEFPRAGLIRADYSYRFLEDLHDRMK